MNLFFFTRPLLQSQQLYQYLLPSSFIAQGQCPLQTIYFQPPLQLQQLYEHLPQSSFSAQHQLCYHLVNPLQSILWYYFRIQTTFTPISVISTTVWTLSTKQFHCQTPFMFIPTYKPFANNLPYDVISESESVAFGWGYTKTLTTEKIS